MPRPDPVIDSVRFAREGGVVSGSIELSRLDRLVEHLESGAGFAEFEVRGGMEEGKALLTITVRAGLRLRCQRCLDGLDYPLAARSRLLLVEDGERWPADESTEERYDAIPAQRELDLVTLVEDEILLALPLAPRHETCEAPAPGLKAGEPRPFAGLAKLLRPN